MAASEKFSVDLTAEAHADLNGLKAFERRQVVEAMASGLYHQPFVLTRNRKPLPGVTAGFEFDPPLWELRVGSLRVFYDGNAANRLIKIRAIRRKEPWQTTQEILL